ncbi:MAG: elongation factor P maturation arginine rhamnosyltransferase EarP, partial [Pseudomonadota bacterium]
AGRAAHQGVAPMAPGEQLLSLFCYDPAPVGDLLDTLAQSTNPTRVLLTPGPATRLAQQWLTTHSLPTSLVLHQLPHLTQDNFDRLLWACDLNFVRGEDSAVRALWAGRPHVWHIYPQDDGVHEDKLNAFMTFWMRDWPSDLTDQVRGLWRCWNGLRGPLSSVPAPALPLQDARWGALSLVSRQRLLEIPDLVTQLLGFIASPR